MCIATLYISKKLFETCTVAIVTALIFFHFHEAEPNTDLKNNLTFLAPNPEHSLSIS